MIIDVEILSAKKCPYCGQDSEYVDSSCVYSKSFGMIYICKDCEAWVGVHKGTDNALGRLANKELRNAKIEAHALFDPLWKRAVKRGRSKKQSRSAAYKWLSKELNIEPQYTHIGMFDVETCKKVVELCEKYYR